MCLESRAGLAGTLQLQEKKARAASWQGWPATRSHRTWPRRSSISFPSVSNTFLHFVFCFTYLFMSVLWGGGHFSFCSDVLLVWSRSPQQLGLWQRRERERVTYCTSAAADAAHRPESHPQKRFITGTKNGQCCGVTVL